MASKPPSPPQVSGLLSAEAAAKFLGINTEVLRRMWRGGRVPGYRVGRVIRFDVDELRAALRVDVSPGGRRTVVTPDFDAIEPKRRRARKA